jgi:diacylglycerol kinase (ATP)
MVVLVVNPTSGGGRGARLLPEVERALADLGVPHRVVVSQDADHPERAAREAAEEGVEVLAAMGGDGLVGACANGVAGTGTALAVIPVGSGNDFARSLGLDHRKPMRSVRVIAEGSRSRIDAVRAEGNGWSRRFVCVAGTGFDSETNAFANSVRRLRGTAKYLYAVVRTLAKFRPSAFRLRVDGEATDLDAMMVAVGNAASYGGGMRVCPDASLRDGLLEVCVVGAMSRARFLAAFPRVFRGTHVTHPDVTMLRGRTVEVEADRPFEVYADGEPFGWLPATFTVEPDALEVMAP